MRYRTAAALATATLLTIAALGAQSAPRSTYLTPPKAVVDILDAAPTPAVVASPDRKVLAVTERRSMPTMAELSQPILRLGGARVNPRTNGLQQRTGHVHSLMLVSIAD